MSIRKAFGHGGRLGGRLAVAVAVMVGGGLGAGISAAASGSGGTTPGPSIASNGAVTVVLGGELKSDGTFVFPPPTPGIPNFPAIPFAYPPRDVMTTGYTVPRDKMFVVDSAYAWMDEFTTGSAPPAVWVGMRSAIPAPTTAYGEACSRDYTFPLTPTVNYGEQSQPHWISGGSLEGPIYVEGGRILRANTEFSSTFNNDSQAVIIFITVHGHLEGTRYMPPPATCPTTPST
ncbi:MAG TPA: hypothetical protein VFH56_04675 [Acidimicrobiales bacterium]|nr:hypothetical protein [Acidimicrobiales bacterium]